MKLYQLILTLVILLFGGAAIYYSCDQDKVMDLLIATHGGGQQVADVDAQGLRKVNSELEAEAARISEERAAAIKNTESAQNVMNDHHNQRDDAETLLNTHKKELADVQASVDAQHASVEALIASIKESLKDLESAGIPDISADQACSEVLESIREFVARQQARKKDLDQQLKDAIAAHKAAAVKLAGEKDELARATRVNTNFFNDYSKNNDEFPVVAVDRRWNYVTFFVGNDSGLVAGDDKTLVVKRGAQSVANLKIMSIDDGLVVAQYSDCEVPHLTNPATVNHPRVGDTVFRLKPLGR